MESRHLFVVYVVLIISSAVVLNTAIKAMCFKAAQKAIERKEAQSKPTACIPPDAVDGKDL